MFYVNHHTEEIFDSKEEAIESLYTSYLLMIDSGAVACLMDIKDYTNEQLHNIFEGREIKTRYKQVKEQLDSNYDYFFSTGYEEVDKKHLCELIKDYEYTWD